jgi:hypothetical protein
MIHVDQDQFGDFLALKKKDVWLVNSRAPGNRF